MTVFRPCNRCPERKDCEIKKSALAQLRGTVSFTTVTIKCERLKASFPPGTRIKAIVFEPRDDEHGQGAREANGTVIKYSTKHRRFLVHFDKDIGMFGRESTKMLTIWADRLAKIDEPLREVCEGGYACDLAGDCNAAGHCSPCDRENNPHIYSRY